MLYKIIRFYANSTRTQNTMARGLTLAQAQAHCSDPETSSRTATNSIATKRTARIGPWFDGYTSDA